MVRVTHHCDECGCAVGDDRVAVELATGDSLDLCRDCAEQAKVKSRCAVQPKLRSSLSVAEANKLLAKLFENEFGVPLGS